LPKKNDELEAAQPKTDSDVTKNDASRPKRAAKPAVAKAEATPEAAPVVKAAAPVETPASATSAENSKAEAPAATASSADKKRLPNPIKMSLPELKRLALRIAIVAVALIAVIVLVFGVLIYGYKSDNQVVRAVSGVVPYPAQKVNGSFVTYSDYLFEVEANKRAYQNNAKLNNQPAVDYNSADGKKLVKQIKEHALEKLKTDAVTAQLASQKKIKVTDKEVNELLDELYKRYGGKDTLLKTLGQIYGWDMADLKKVIRKQLLAKKLEDKVTSDPALDAQAKAKAKDVSAKIKDGGDFGELAKQYSQASDASTGGDLGSFTKGQMPEDVQKAVDALQAGQVSDPVKTSYGYEIIKVLEKTGDTTKAQHILITTIDYNNFFNGELKKAKTNTYIKA
jgi:parvulin-like peptidyl-prolyl isomerase